MLDSMLTLPIERIGSVRTLLTLPFSGRGVSYSCEQVLLAMQGDRFRQHLTVPYVIGRAPAVPATASMTRQFGRVLNKVAPASVLRIAERDFLRDVDQDPGARTVYLWSETSAKLAGELRARDLFVVREKTNCSKALSKRVLDDAYRRLDLRPRHGLTDEAVAEEKRRLHLADAVFCPNELVRQSLLELGLPEERLWSTSYGFDPARFQSEARLLPPVDGPTFLFVGTICVRKGAHLILRAWARSGVKGRLVLAGAMEPVIKAVCARELARPDVLALPYVNDVAALYNSADAFVFPSIEEGDPLVTREAAYCGLPCLVSPMGAGRIVRDGEEGHVIDPYAEDHWVEAIRLLAARPGLRERMGQAAHRRALGFTWAEVGRMRRQAFAVPHRRPTLAGAA